VLDEYESDLDAVVGRVEHAMVMAKRRYSEVCLVDVYDLKVLIAALKEDV